MFGSGLRRLEALIFSGLQVIVVGLLGVMIVLVFGNVVLRYAFNSSIIVSEELSRWCLLWLTYFGALVALKRREHLAVTLVIDRLGPTARRVCLGIAYSLMILVSAMFFLGAWSQMMLNLGVTGTVVPLSLAFFYGTGVIFGGGAVLILLADLWRIVVRGEDILGLDAEPDPARHAELHHEV